MSACCPNICADCAHFWFSFLGPKKGPKTEESLPLRGVPRQTKQKRNQEATASQGRGGRRRKGRDREQPSDGARKEEGSGYKWRKARVGRGGREAEGRGREGREEGERRGWVEEARLPHPAEAKPLPQRRGRRAQKGELRVPNLRTKKRTYFGYLFSAPQSTWRYPIWGPYLVLVLGTTSGPVINFIL